MEVYLYLICQAPKDEPVCGPCKVGISHNPAGRLKALRTASPHKLVIYELWNFLSRDFAVHAERLAHAALGEHRMSGEWFSLPPDKARASIESWFFWAAAASAEAKGTAPVLVRDRIGMVANGLADEAGRLL